MSDVVSGDSGVRAASLSRALLVLIEGLERTAGDTAWPELRQRASRAVHVLTSQLVAAKLARFGVDRPVLCALRRVTTDRARSERVATACSLYGLISLAEVRSLADLDEPSRATITATIRDEALAEGHAVAASAFAELEHALDSGAPSGSVLSELNPDAGTHPLPDDLRAIAVALDAGQRSFDEYAYYDLRYGERGRAFTRTDSAWLVAIAGLRIDVTRQISWLARVLASRGMPSLLLEAHLDLLANALVATLPSFALHADALQHAAEGLRSARLGALFDFDEQRDALEKELEAARAIEQDAVPITTREAATLAVAAVADARAGIQGATENLAAWLADGARFGSAWCAALNRAFG